MGYKLEYIIEEELKTFVLQKDLISVGKLDDNDLVLRDTAISRRHFSLEKVLDGFRIIDLNSTNGTFVNGSRIKEYKLKLDDEISIGRIHLKFTLAEEDVNINEIDDQKISMVIPLGDELNHDKEIYKKDIDVFTSLTELGKELISSSCIDTTFEKVGNLYIFFYN